MGVFNVEGSVDGKHWFLFSKKSTLHAARESASKCILNTHHKAVRITEEP
jgi:hypothetical protein